VVFFKSASRRDCESHGAKDLSLCYTDVQEFHLWYVQRPLQEVYHVDCRVPARLYVLYSASSTFVVINESTPKQDLEKVMGSC
jgi:hypothetical protein